MSLYGCHYRAVPGTSYRAAVADIAGGCGSWSLSGLMAWFDIRQRYRRSVLGPLWSTISLITFAAAVSLVYSRLLGTQGDASYPLYVALGLLIWGFIAGVITEACVCFTAHDRLIREIRVPLFCHVLRLVWRNLILFFHNVVVYPLLLIYLELKPEPIALLSLAGIVLMVANAAWIGLVIGIVSARFRDLPPLIANALQLSFFITPVLWLPSMLGGITRGIVADYNPLSAMIDVVRAPLMGQLPNATSYYVVVGSMLIGWGIALVTLAHCRARLAYWL